jgi:hypothetical protein
MIRKLIALGYPPELLKYYRGGMQAWRSVGLTTVNLPAVAILTRLNAIVGKITN